jgi:hypothetical protein
MGKGKMHYIEVLLDSDEEEAKKRVQDNELNSSYDEKPHEEAKGGTIATLSCTPIFNSFRVRGVL